MGHRRVGSTACVGAWLAVVILELASIDTDVGSEIHRLLLRYAKLRTVRMRSGQRAGLDVQGENFALMLKSWRLDHPQILAHDFGGAVTLRAHLLRDCAFDRLVLMNVVAVRPLGLNRSGGM